MPTRRHLLISLIAAGAIPRPAAAAEISAHDFAFAGIDGDVIRLADWAGRPIMVVNTASQCGFTYQYDGLQALYDAYRDRGLIVLAVPSDDFGGQELESEAKVKEFCEVNFGLDFPMTSITPVKGLSAHPFYVWAATEGGRDAIPAWNFHKILIGPDGNIAGTFRSNTEPTSHAVHEVVEAALAGARPPDSASPPPDPAARMPAFSSAEVFPTPGAAPGR